MSKRIEPSAPHRDTRHRRATVLTRPFQRSSAGRPGSIPPHPELDSRWSIWNLSVLVDDATNRLGRRPRSHVIDRRDDDLIDRTQIDRRTSNRRGCRIVPSVELAAAGNRLLLLFFGLSAERALGVDVGGSPSQHLTAFRRTRARTARHIAEMSRPCKHKLGDNREERGRRACEIGH